jgi:membrane-bound serine protease (ClpP class)
MKIPYFIILTSFLTTALGSVLKVEIDGPIDPVRAEFIRDAVSEADKRNAELLLIRLDTPGGLGVSMQEVITEILNSPVPVVCYVSPAGGHAASAGFFILLAADLAAMAPATNTGAAHPVFPFGMDDPVMMKKVRNDALANLRSIVERRNRSYELAEKGVLESHSYTAQEALKGNLIDLIATDEKELLRKLEGVSVLRPDGTEIRLNLKGKKVESYLMTRRQRILGALANPNLALLFGVVGLILLWIEFQAPGMLLPAVIGLVSLTLSLLGFSLLPINYIGVILILLGVSLVVGEVFFQGFGVLGIGGAISFVLGLVFLIDSPYPDLRIGWGIALSLGVPVALISFFFFWTLFRGASAKIRTGAEGLMGETGVTRSVVDDSGGRVFLKGELWTATAAGEIEAGVTVVIKKIKGLTLVVTEKDL